MGTTVLARLDTPLMDTHAVSMTLTNVPMVLISATPTQFVLTPRLDTTANVDLDGNVMECHAHSHVEILHFPFQISVKK